MWIVFVAVGIAAIAKGYDLLAKGLKRDALYEESRLNRIRTLNQQGDTEV